MLEYPWGSPTATATPTPDEGDSTPTDHDPNQHHPYSFPAPLYGTPTNPGPFDSIEYSRNFSGAAYPPTTISFDPAGFLIYPKPEPAFESPSNYVNPVGRIGLNLGLSSGRAFSDEEFVNRLYRRPRSFDTPRCQAEGCFVDLTHAKHYHRRHKVCELHSKASTVVTSGLTQRFCQQCSRFHVLSEFDNGKRSCRRRLADHNRRRRKSHQLATATQNSSCSDNPPTPIPESPSNSGAVSEMSPDSNCYNNSSAASSSVSTPSSSSMFY